MILPKIYSPLARLEEDCPAGYKRGDRANNNWIQAHINDEMQGESSFDIEEMKKSMPINVIAQKLKAEGLTLLQTGKLLYPTCCCGSKNEIDALKQKVRRLILKK